MPIYEYESEKPGDCPQCHARFEVIQAISASPLARCPSCTRPVRRVFSSPTIHGAGRSAELLSNKSLAEKGFTKYVKKGAGYYEKTAGKGPDAISRR